MVAVPEVRYAKNGGLHIAYQVLGDGPFDLVAGSGLGFVPRGTHHLRGVPDAWDVYQALPAGERSP